LPDMCFLILLAHLLLVVFHCGYFKQLSWLRICDRRS